MARPQVPVRVRSAVELIPPRGEPKVRLSPRVSLGARVSLRRAHATRCGAILFLVVARYGSAITRAPLRGHGARDVRLRGSLVLHFPPSTQHETTPAIYVARASARPRLQIGCGRVRILGGVQIDLRCNVSRRRASEATTRPFTSVITGRRWQQSRWVMPNLEAGTFPCAYARDFGM